MDGKEPHFAYKVVRQVIVEESCWVLARSGEEAVELSQSGLVEWKETSSEVTLWEAPERRPISL